MPHIVRTSIASNGLHDLSQATVTDEWSPVKSLRKPLRKHLRKRLTEAKVSESGPVDDIHGTGRAHIRKGD